MKTVAAAIVRPKQLNICVLCLQPDVVTDVAVFTEVHRHPPERARWKATVVMAPQR